MKYIYLTLSFLCFSAAGSPSRSQQDLQYLLHQDCGSCHGMTLKGGLGPDLLPETLKDKSDQYLFTVIQYGIPGTAMPPWKNILTDNETKQLIKIIRKTNTK